jgi:hypothetical protein
MMPEYYQGCNKKPQAVFTRITTYGTGQQTFRISPLESIRIAIFCAATLVAKGGVVYNWAYDFKKNDGILNKEDKPTLPPAPLEGGWPIHSNQPTLRVPHSCGLIA